MEARWIKASVAKHFTTQLAGQVVYIEGSERNISAENFFELKMDGPDYEDYPGTRWWRVWINLLVQTTISRSDIHKEERNIDIGRVAFDPCIIVKKYGDDPDVTVGVLRLIGKVEISKIGRINSSTNLSLSSIEAVYQMET